MRSVVGNIPGMNHDRSRLTPLTAGARRGDRRLQVCGGRDLRLVGSGSAGREEPAARYSKPPQPRGLAATTTDPLLGHQPLHHASSVETALPCLLNHY